jgi:hypothetical protein
MKRLIVTKIFSVLFICLSIGQYKAMLKDSSEWYVFHYFEASCNETFKIIGDSQINDKVYKKLIADPYCNGWGGSERINLLREDTTEKKVYKLLSDTSEVVLYDYNLKPGQNVKIFHDNSYFTELTLDSITDKIFHYSGITIPENSKVFYFKIDEYSQAVWIEGIGSLTGPLTSDYVWANGSFGEDLLCHINSRGIHDYNSKYWQTDSSCKGPIMNSIKDIDLTTKIAVFPIPASDVINIKIESGLDIFSLKLINDMGMLIYSDTNIKNQEFKIECTNLSTGIYLLIIETMDHKMITSKVLKK